jgi:very-short-patch-repair endonuclease
MRKRDSIVLGQRIDPMKLALAKRLRRRMTPAEWRLWQALRRNQLDGLQFRRQQVIAGFIVDFYCHAARLAVEVDGPIHRQRLVYDAERDAALGQHAIAVLRVRNAAVMSNLAGVLERIRRACRRRMKDEG